jgi:hypothetical protein
MPWDGPFGDAISANFLSYSPEIRNGGGAAPREDT